MPTERQLTLQHTAALIKKCVNNVAKFSQNRDLKTALLDTSSKTLVEASPLDVIWGIGLDKSTALQTPVSQWRGLNLLGQILMRVRATIREMDASARDNTPATTTTNRYNEHDQRDNEKVTQGGKKG
jgi:hypothetical protein